VFKSFKENKGFTLVELIVVIAIIAILAAVSIVGYSRYIDNARFSNDTQVAASMTTVLQNHLILNPDDNLTLSEVRSIITIYSEGMVDFNPSASDTGLFYIEENHSIIAARFDDIPGLDEFELKQGTTILLNDQGTDLDSPDEFSSPEELFGEGTFLLSTSGSAIALAVNYISNQLFYAGDIGNSYDALVALVDQSNTLWNQWISGTSTYSLDMIDALIDYYDPSIVLFVNNSNWLSSADTGTAIERIVFATGISNLPPYDAGLETTLPSIELPSTIRTIQDGALTDLSSVAITLSAATSETIKVEGTALDGVSYPSMTTSSFSEEDLMDLSDEVSITQFNNKLQYNLGSLSIRSDVTGYEVTLSSNHYALKIFTGDGYVAFAEGTVGITTLTYYYGFTQENMEWGSQLVYGDDILSDNIYTSITTVSNTYVLPIEPIRIGYNFQGWFSSPNGLGVQLANGDEINYTKLYGHWTIKDYTVVFNPMGGYFVTKGICIKEVNYEGTVVTAPTVPLSLGYTFDSWYVDRDLTIPYTFGTEMPEIGFELYAKWLPND